VWQLKWHAVMVTFITVFHEKVGFTDITLSCPSCDSNIYITFFWKVIKREKLHCHRMTNLPHNCHFPDMLDQLLIGHTTIAIDESISMISIKMFRLPVMVLA
jgi:hypothetical protein